MDKRLIIYASFGQGHEKAAYALAEASGSPCYDLMDFTNPSFKKIYSLSYTVTTKYFPLVWKVIFFSAKIKFFSIWINRIHKIIFFGFLEYLTRVKPKIIVATHFYPASLAAIVKDELDIKIVSIVTDFRVHPLWVEKKVDYYFVASKEAKDDLINMGVSREIITSGYVPLRKGFLQKINREDLIESFNLPDRPCILFVSSLRGRFPFLRKVIETLKKKFNIFIIYGNNKKLLKYLKEINSPYIRYFSFYERIWELVSLSSVIVTKPGGLTLFEGTYKNKFFVFTHYIPGQEKENMDLLIKSGVGRFAETKQDLVREVNYFSSKLNDTAESYPVKVYDITAKFESLMRELEDG